jgi:hypothetical protein
MLLLLQQTGMLSAHLWRPCWSGVNWTCSQGQKQCGWDAESWDSSQYHPALRMQLEFGDQCPSEQPWWYIPQSSTPVVRRSMRIAQNLHKHPRVIHRISSPGCSYEDHAMPLAGKETANCKSGATLCCWLLHSSRSRHSKVKGHCRVLRS